VNGPQDEGTFEKTRAAINANQRQAEDTEDTVTAVTRPWVVVSPDFVRSSPVGYSHIDPTVSILDGGKDQ
jgi:hypothetical protein